MAGYHCWHTTGYRKDMGNDGVEPASRHMCCKCGITSVQQKGRRLIGNGCEKAPAPNLSDALKNEMLALQHSTMREKVTS